MAFRISRGLCNLGRPRHFEAGRYVSSSPHSSSERSVGYLLLSIQQSVASGRHLFQTVSPAEPSTLRAASARVITPASSAPAASAAPTPARETAPRPRASTGDPGARTRGTGGPTPCRRARPPGTETLHHRTHSFPVPASPPARPDPSRAAAAPALPRAAWTGRLIEVRRNAGAGPARR